MNSLRYAKKLEEVGFSREQAEMTIGILSDVVEGNLATKQDLISMGADLRSEMKDLSFKIDHMESKIVIRLGGMMIAGFAIMCAAIPMIIKFMGS